jgi:hypothetical protein
MDDQVLMRVVHRGADVTEETKARRDPELAPIAVHRDRHAVDVLHDEKRKLVVGDTAVEQLRDATVSERGEDLSFGDEAPMQFLGVGARAQQLHRNALLVLSVVSLGQVDDAHAATAKLTQHAIRADPPAAVRVSEGAQTRGDDVSFQHALRALVGDE